MLRTNSVTSRIAYTVHRNSTYAVNAHTGRDVTTSAFHRHVSSMFHAPLVSKADRFWSKLYVPLIRQEYLRFRKRAGGAYSGRTVPVPDIWDWNGLPENYAKHWYTTWSF
jgi:hypothetical protein